MNEEAQMCLDEAGEGMEGALSHLEREFQKIRAGKASPQMLEGIMIDYYGTIDVLHLYQSNMGPHARPR